MLEPAARGRGIARARAPWSRSVVEGCGQLVCCRRSASERSEGTRRGRSDRRRGCARVTCSTAGTTILGSTRAALRCSSTRCSSHGLILATAPLMAVLIARPARVRALAVTRSRLGVPFASAVLIGSRLALPGQLVRRGSGQRRGAGSPLGAAAKACWSVGRWRSSRSGPAGIVLVISRPVTALVASTLRRRSTRVAGHRYRLEHRHAGSSGSVPRALGLAARLRHQGQRSPAMTASVGAAGRRRGRPRDSGHCRRGRR